MLLPYISVVSLVSATAFPSSMANSSCDPQCQIDKVLGPKLSAQASIVHTTLAVPRWSDFDAPNPGSVVNVASEHDVLLTVCILSLCTGNNSMLNICRCNIVFRTMSAFLHKMAGMHGVPPSILAKMEFLSI